MRILLVDLESALRGGQSQALLLLKGLTERGHAAELLCVEGSALAGRAQSENISVTTVPPSWRRARAAAAVRRLLRARSFDIVHANEAHALTAAWLGEAHRHAALVAARRVTFPLGTSPLSRARYHAARRIIAISRFVAQRVADSGVPARVLDVVYDGVEIPPPSFPELQTRRAARERWGTRDDQPLIGSIGYLVPQKGQEFLLRALPEIHAHFPACRILLGGDGPLRAHLAQIAAEMKVESSVCFAGYVQNVSEVYAAVDVFVFPSLGEGLGSSLLAAMAASLPVVAVASGGVPEAVQEGAGLLVPEANPTAIAEATVRILSNPRLAASLGHTARGLIEQQFSADRMVEGTLRSYELARMGG